MPRARRIATLAIRHHRLLLRCWLLLAKYRAILTLRSYHSILREIRALDGTESPKSNPLLLTWGVTHAARAVPGATCLTQSLALRYLLARSGQPAAVRIGVSETEHGDFDAHAWVISDGQVLIGGTQDKIERYVPIVDL